jgi:nucleotide-binding universal stress UspA family protein
VAPSAHFTFLHAFHVPGENIMQEVGVSAEVIHKYRMRARDAAREDLNKLIESLGPRKQLISRTLHNGVTATVIRDQAKRLNADLIALGKHSEPRFAELFPDSTAQRLVDQGSCDVLVTAAPDSWDTDYLPAA